MFTFCGKKEAETFVLPANRFQLTAILVFNEMGACFAVLNKAISIQARGKASKLFGFLVS